MTKIVSLLMKDCYQHARQFLFVFGRCLFRIQVYELRSMIPCFVVFVFAQLTILICKYFVNQVSLNVGMRELFTDRVCKFLDFIALFS